MSKATIMMTMMAIAEPINPHIKAFEPELLLESGGKGPAIETVLDLGPSLLSSSTAVTQYLT